MSDFVMRSEFERLATRVDIVEREAEGGKMVTRHILAETRRAFDDLAAIETRLDRVEQKVDVMGQQIAELRQDFVGLGGTVSGLAAGLPGLIADTMREVLRERDGR